MSAVVSVNELTPARWWEVAALDEDPVETRTWYRTLVVQVPGDGEGILLEVMVSDEGGPIVDVLSQEHTVTDLRALAGVLPALIDRLAALPVTRFP